jgi:hypothetical protein
MAITGGSMSGWLGLGALALMSMGSMGCKAALSPPFDAMRGQPVTILRLQNYEPPAAAPQAASIQLPAQIQGWLTAGAQLLPPGLLPPGLLPGTAPAAPAANDLRFHNFRILGSTGLASASDRDEVLDIFGHQGNFDSRPPTCMYAEFGFAIGQLQAQPGVGTQDLLVSLSCEQVQAFNFNWPYPSATAIPSDTAKRIVAIAQKAFGGGA